MGLSNLWQPKFIIAALQDFTWVEVSHPHRNWAKNIHVLLSQADDLVERGFVLHIDWKGAVDIIPPSVFLFPLVSGNEPSDVSQDTYVRWLTIVVLMSRFDGEASIVECVFAETLKIGMSWNARNASPPFLTEQEKSFTFLLFFLSQCLFQSLSFPSYFERHSTLVFLKCVDITITMTSLSTE